MRYTIHIEKRRGKTDVFDDLIVYCGENRDHYFKAFSKLCEAFMVAENIVRAYFKQEEGFEHAYIEVTL